MFGLSLTRLIVYGLLVAGVLAAGTWAVHTYNESLREEGRAEIRAADDRREREAADAELVKAHANAAVTLRRIDTQGENHAKAAADLAGAVADAAGARDAERLLRNDVATLEAVASGAAASDSAALASREAAAAASRMLAELQRRADERAGILASYGDTARIAGVTCERDYDALTAK